tara:strand:+ start:95352 stop:96227 length:876 start_codon:yes stop_codon:yes gene_type:complete
MVLRIGSRGHQVELLQEYLNIGVDGHFGSRTEFQVMEWQRANGLKADGVVGPQTWDAMGLASTDMGESNNNVGLNINQYFLPRGEYKDGPTNKDYLFLHHTAGWHNPYNQVDQWGRDNRGAIGTEFVLGGQSIIGNDNQSDGIIVQAIPDGGYGWHLGKNGSQYMHTHSVGIEVCNFGWLKDGRTYAGTQAADSQITVLQKPFRGFDMWHTYSDTQLRALYDLIIYIAQRDNIDVRAGLVEGIHQFGPGAFDFNQDAFYGKIKGMWSHTNTRKDKTDMYPDPRLLDMLLSL